ncbi:hypothetical protein MMC30_000531 [Trapelia coarctata]|nr:hypothetical protein [Trapelia coarctata]
MARAQKRSNIKKNGRQPSVLKIQGRGVEKQKPVRKSAHLRVTQRLCEQPVTKDTHIQGIRSFSSPPAKDDPAGKKVLQKPRSLPKTTGSQRKRKRSQEPDNLFTRNQLTRKRPRNLPSGGGIKEDIFDQRAASDISEDITPIKFWTWTGKWKREYFEQDSQVRKDFRKDCALEGSDQENWCQEPAGPVGTMNGLGYLLAKKRSSSSLRRKNSESSLQTPSDQLPREAKSAQYRTTNYEIILATKGSYMEKSSLGITDASKRLYQRLLKRKQTVPQDSSFRDDLFDKACERIRIRNESMVIRDIGLLIVPSAQTLATYGATHLEHLMESVNEGWNSAIPFYGARPQPDYSVGFRRSAFTDDQLQKLEPFVGDILYGSGLTSYFMATSQMYFPFLTCEVKCGAAALDVADRQNAHSMTLAVRGVVELYKAVKREKELHREILAFSISHDHRSVRIYGHYAIIEEGKTTFYRHPIHDFSFTTLDGRDKWTAYKFTKNVYDVWMPIQHKRICSAIDELPPDIDFDLSQVASFSQSGPQGSQQSNAESTWMPEEDDSQSSLVGSQEVTPTTSFTQTTERTTKRPRNQRAAGGQC